MKVRETVRHLMRQGKGILAADESVQTITERFAAHGVPSTAETRRAYRTLLLTTPGCERFLSGVIMHDETIRDAMTDGTPFTDFCITKDILVGVKVDQGLVLDAQFPGGEVTSGLDGLRGRLQEYAERGATFAKWRAVTRVGAAPGNPALRESVSRMAAYAAAALAEGMVPIVEPEVLMEGPHTAAEAEQALAETLSAAIDALQARDIDLSTVLLKTAMAVPGSAAPDRAPAEEVAERTIRALTTAVPESMGGVVFLSGGQTPEEATRNLNALSRCEPLPWPITFSFARALQTEALAAWGGSDERVADAQAAFIERLTLVAAADAAAYSPLQEERAL